MIYGMNTVEAERVMGLWKALCTEQELISEFEEHVLERLHTFQVYSFSDLWSSFIEKIKEGAYDDILGYEKDKKAHYLMGVMSTIYNIVFNEKYLVNEE